MITYSIQQIEEAKNVDLIALALSEGLQIGRQTAKGYLFCSPFREDPTPSFHIYRSKYGFYLAQDFAGEKAMNSIQFVQRLHKLNFPQAIKYLLEFEAKEPTSFSFAQPTTEKSQGIEIRKLIPTLQNKALITYLKSRKINIEFASKCPLLYECYYRPNGKTRSGGKDFFALAFKNHEGGYDLRSQTFKGKFGSNAISYISHPNSKNSAVFEGFMDYLSALTHYQVAQSNHNIIILNSINNVQKVLSILQKFDKVFLYLDNDAEGQKATAFLQENLPNVCDQSHIYQEFTDFNEFLIRSKK